MKPLSLMNLALASILAAQSAHGFQYPDCAHGPLANTTVCDTKASPPERAAELVRLLNITEKLSNLVDNSLGAERVGLPSYQWWNEALHGVAGSPGVTFNRTGGEFSYATSFANAITLSAAFDDDLIFDIGTVVSTEARAFANAGRAGLDFWTPNINPFKDPRWGRGSETPGEDPFRIKGYTKAILAGLEGNQAIRKVIATCKHYAAYDLERWKGITRYRFDAIVSSQDLSEYYLPPFQQCARDSKVGSIMCSYNSLNGTPACASTYLMTDILREHWGWKEDNNFITSDCNAIQDFLPNQHNFTQTAAQAAAAAYKAGTDTVCEVAGYPPMTDVFGAHNQTLLSEETVDIALRRLYEGLIRAGYFDPAASSPYRSLGWSDVNTPVAQALALRSAAEGIVLLKNDGVLPVTLTNKTVALIGHWATVGRQMLGGYSGIPPFFHTPEYAVQQLNLTYYTASGPIAEDNNAKDTWTTAALAAANKADIVLYFGGTDLSISAEDKDRDAIAWPAAQLSLINKLAALGKPLTVIQLGDQVDDTPLLTNKNISAVLWAGYPGQAGGTAVLDIITGKTAPAGRLPVTQYPAAYTDQVPLTEMALRPTANSPGRTYRWYKAPVLPFGHGLHYTTFNTTLDHPFSTTSNTDNTYSIESLYFRCDAKTVKQADLCRFTPAIAVNVTNTGNLTSDYVVLLFVAGEFGPQPYPIKTLVAYKRLRDIQPGETVRAELDVTLGALARVDLTGSTYLYPGNYRLFVDVDGGAAEAGGETSFTLEDEALLLDLFPQPKKE
ncbi:glycoside hydrolase family 3 protein [Bombardia bombarda]|uniref:xylan 1,4-beta-xylosidase n=1 Tax=Bombardia bombarda TaxID=252184 RepID=A0AA39XBK5_9PEZI|nr:glycoside hydrolase family 3 protein [Bombardia bombarda]